MTAAVQDVAGESYKNLPDMKVSIAAVWHRQRYGSAGLFQGRRARARHRPDYRFDRRPRSPSCRLRKTPRDRHRYHGTGKSTHIEQWRRGSIGHVRVNLDSHIAAST